MERADSQRAWERVVLRRNERKKKALNSPTPREESIDREPHERFQSIFQKKPETPEADAVFLPPEAFGSSMSFDEMSIELASASAWDVATRYHEFKAKP